MGELNVSVVCEGDYDYHVASLVRAIIRAPSIKCLNVLGDGIDISAHKELKDTRIASSLASIIGDKEIHAVIVSSTSGTSPPVSCI